MTQAAALAQTINSIRQFSPTDLPLEQSRFELLTVTVNKTNTKAAFMAREDSLVTSRFPGFEKSLLQILPNLLQNVKCYNGQNHHFSTEMLATETGHLYEHIWLEVLCCEKLRTCKTAHYAGETSWNWKKDPRGLFHITLNANQDDQDLIKYTSEISMRILEQVLV